MTSWMFLILAGILEIGFTTTMKLSEGFTKLYYLPVFVVFSLGSFFFLNKSLADIPLGTAYAVWTGVGAFGTAVLGIVFFKEPATLLRMLFLLTLIGSVIGLKLVSVP